jgi:hypothetical protein
MYVMVNVRVTAKESQRCVQMGKGGRLRREREKKNADTNFNVLFVNRADHLLGEGG